MRTLINNIDRQLEELRIKLNDETATFCEQSEYDNHDDIIFDIPRIYQVTKHGFHVEYCILNINQGKIDAMGLCEDAGESLYTTIDSLSPSELLAIGSEIYNK
jgi:hypothetical protein